MERLLLIEDEPSMQIVLKHCLKDAYEIISKNNGLEALEWLESGNTVDIILTDLNMPFINGFEMVQSIRSSNLLGDTPIIVLSSSETSSDRVKCLELGADDFVMKPFNPLELKLRIRNILRRCYKAQVA